MNANLRNFALWVIIVLLLLALFTLFQNPGQRTTAQDISFSQLLTEVDNGRVRDVTIQGPEIHGTYTNGGQFNTYAPNDPSLVQRLYGKGVQITARPQGDNVPWFVSLLVSWLPNVERFELPDATHLLHLQNPRGMAEALAAFYASHPVTT